MMKIWNSYGSEHSANLVMIGTFKEVDSAEKAKALIDDLTNFVTSGEEDFFGAERYSPGALKVLEKLRFYSASPEELSQFHSEVRSELKGNQIVITTDEIEVSAFLKLLLDKGARVEVYSAHQYPDTATPPDSQG